MPKIKKTDENQTNLSKDFITDVECSVKTNELEFPETPVETSAEKSAENVESPAAQVKDSNTISIKEVKELIEQCVKPVQDLLDSPKEKIDWESKIDPQFIVLNRQKKDEIEKTYQKKFYDIDIVEDKVDRKKYCLVLLQGMRDLLDTRGYESVDYTINYCSPDFVSATCHITFTPLYYDEPLKNRKYSFGADAHRGNTASWYGDYLTAAAFNRAMCLCLRNALKINTVCYEEIGSNIKNIEEEAQSPAAKSDSFSPHAVLQKKLDVKNTPFEKFKHYCEGKSIEGSKEWNKISDIPTGKVLEMIKLMEDREKEKVESKKEVSS